MKTTITLAVAALIASTAQSQITSEDDSFFGVDSITRDAAQQLEFLDLPLSTNRSFDDVSTQFGAGGDFEGWRYASQAEVFALATNWGFTTSAQIPGSGVASQSVPSDSTGDQLSGLVQLVGVTLTNTQLFDISDGITSDILTGDFAGDLRRIRIFDWFSGPDAMQVEFVPQSQTFQSVGSWLVRPVPAPSSAALLCFAGLASARRRR